VLHSIKFEKVTIFRVTFLQNTKFLNCNYSDVETPRLSVDIRRYCGTVGAVNSAATVSTVCSCNYLHFSIAQQSLVGQGLLIIDALRSHSFRYTTLGRTPLDE
jgi:hypothetical protein